MAESAEKCAQSYVSEFETEGALSLKAFATITGAICGTDSHVCQMIM